MPERELRHRELAWRAPAAFRNGDPVTGTQTIEESDSGEWFAAAFPHWKQPDLRLDGEFRAVRPATGSSGESAWLIQPARRLLMRSVPPILWRLLQGGCVLPDGIGVSGVWIQRDRVPRRLLVQCSDVVSGSGRGR